jgi:glycosyltransferase involved in cell wall biosynthesis
MKRQVTRIAVNAQAYEHSLPTGIGTYTEQLYQHIWAIDATNKYVFFSNRHSERLEQCGGDNVAFMRAPSPLANKYLRVGWENAVLPIRLLKGEVDLLHSVNYSLPFLMPSRIKKIVTVNDLIWLKFPDQFPRDSVRAAKKRFQHACRSADAIISISENTREDVLEGFHCSDEKLRVIYDGVDIERFRKSRGQPSLEQGMRLKHHLPNNFILWVGGYRKHKNVELLCSAFSMAKRRVSLPHKLVLCGPDLLSKPSVRDILARHGDDIMAVGPVTDEELVMLYSIADAFVFPSLYEGFGLPVLEAMACGTPVITSNRSSLPEVAGNAAILVNPDVEEQIADAIVNVITDDSLRQLLCQRGLERVKLFTWENTAHETLKLFEEVMGQR